MLNPRVLTGSPLSGMSIGVARLFRESRCSDNKVELSRRSTKGIVVLQPSKSAESKIKMIRLIPKLLSGINT